MKKIIALVGPTGVGKTSVSLDLAEKWEAEIICVDSLLVYKYFDIGTAKPTRSDQDRVKHHLIDLVEPTGSFTAGDFVRATRKAIADIQQRHKQVLLVGGTGLYLKALLEGMYTIPSVPKELKRKMRERCEAEGSQLLHEELKSVDPVSGERLHPNDSYRITRALEVFYGTGKPLSFYREQYRPSPNDQVRIMGISLPKSEHQERVKRRTAEMLALGLIEEVSELSRRFPRSCKPFGSIGYKEGLEFIDGKLMQEELCTQICRQTMALAKRQKTWFNANPSIIWTSASDSDSIYRL